MPKELYTPQEAADLLMVTLNTVRKWLRTGELEGFKIGKFWRIRRTALESFIKKKL